MDLFTHVHVAPVGLAVHAAVVHGAVVHVGVIHVSVVHCRDGKEEGVVCVVRIEVEEGIGCIEVCREYEIGAGM